MIPQRWRVGRIGVERDVPVWYYDFTHGVVGASTTPDLSGNQHNGSFSNPGGMNLGDRAYFAADTDRLSGPTALWMPFGDSVPHDWTIAATVELHAAGGPAEQCVLSAAWAFYYQWSIKFGMALDGSVGKAWVILPNAGIVLWGPPISDQKVFIMATWRQSDRRLTLYCGPDSKHAPEVASTYVGGTDIPIYGGYLDPGMTVGDGNADGRGLRGYVYNVSQWDWAMTPDEWWPLTLETTPV